MSYDVEKGANRYVHSSLQSYRKKCTCHHGPNAPPWGKHLTFVEGAYSEGLIPPIRRKISTYSDAPVSPIEMTWFHLFGSTPSDRRLRSRPLIGHLRSLQLALGEQVGSPAKRRKAEKR